MAEDYNQDSHMDLTSAPLNCRVGRSVIVLCSKDFSVSSKKQLFRPFSIA